MTYEIRTQRNNGSPNYYSQKFGTARTIRRWVCKHPQAALGYYRTFWTDDYLLTPAEVSELMGPEIGGRR